MSRYSLFAVLCVLHINALTAQTTQDSFTLRTVACALSQPWEITVGPDDHLWVMEGIGYQLTRIEPKTGAKTTILSARDQINWTWGQYPLPQSGFSGLAIHPELLTGKPYIYLGYTYQFDGCQTNNTLCKFKTKVVRYTYDASTLTVHSPRVLVDTIPGSNDHNGGRMLIGPYLGKPYLFYAVGDMGAGQFSNAVRTNQAQNPDVYEGKILRFSLEPDQDTDPTDQWIPNDNPYNTQLQRQSAVWSIGHRNPQGLTQHPNGTIYETEHGPYSDDELNIIEPHRNYGFPIVVGFAADGNYDGSKVGVGVAPYIFSEQQNADLIGADYKDPIKTFYPAPHDTIKQIHTNMENYYEPYPNYWLHWPSIAPSGIAFYTGDSVLAWKNHLFIASLKRATVFHLELDLAGKVVKSDTIGLLHGQGRFRDLAFSRDGRSLFVACDTTGPTAGPTLGSNLVPINRGCILEYRLHVPTPPPVSSAISPLDHHQLVIWPNPAHHLLHIKHEGQPMKAKCSLTDLSGKTILSTDVMLDIDTKMDVSRLHNGTYFLCIQGTDGSKHTEKVIIGNQ
jgi:PQQ-dependent dehydrogenase (s-GDH family)